VGGLRDARSLPIGISLFLEYGWSPDPVGEFLRSLDLVDGLGARLALSGHGRPFTDVHAHIEGNRSLVAQHLTAVCDGLAAGPRTALQLARQIFDEPLSEVNAAWQLSQTLCYLHHLELDGRVNREPDGDAERWRQG
jgi:hypothetical protein